MACEGIGVLMDEMQGVGACLLLGNRAWNSLVGNVFRANTHGQALAECTGLKQVGDADFIAARRALEHALCRRALKGRTAKRARDGHVLGFLVLRSGGAVFP